MPEFEALCAGYGWREERHADRAVIAAVALARALHPGRDGGRIDWAVLGRPLGVSRIPGYRPGDN